MHGPAHGPAHGFIYRLTRGLVWLHNARNHRRATPRTLPAAVIWPAKKRPKALAASTTAR
eukprot:5931912-Prymnesium_polylepis.2